MVSSYPAPPGEHPIASKDRAETFEESDVTLSSKNGQILQNNNSVGIDFQDYSIERGNTTVLTDLSETDWWGVTITPQVDMDSITLRYDTSATEEEIQVIRDDTSEVVYQDTSPPTTTSGDTLTVSPTGGFVSGVSYSFSALIAQGSDLTYYGSLDNPASDFGNSIIDISGGAYFSSGPEENSDRWSVWDKVVPSFSGYLEATAFIEWPQPTDIYRWDAATFTTTEDSGSVEVYIEESTDGGSTWDEIAGPISRGQQIGASPDSEVRFRVDISREDTANNPTLDSVYRRWVV